MRRKDKEIKESAEIENILRKSSIVRIAISANPAPYIVPLNYGYKDNCLYIHAAKNGRKINLLRQNSIIGFEIEGDSKIKKSEISCEWTTKYQSLIGIAKAEILNERSEIIEGLDILMQHFGKKENIYDEKYFQRIVIIKLSIMEITGKKSEG